MGVGSFGNGSRGLGVDKHFASGGDDTSLSTVGIVTGHLVWTVRQQEGARGVEFDAGGLG